MMSEKRFSYGRKNDLNFGYCPHCIRDLQEDKIFTDYTEIADLLNKQSDEIGNLKSENEQLKKTMQKVCELLEEEVDLFSDKATEHDVIAYREMQKFDNKDAYYICTATKKAIQMLKGRDSDE